MTKTKLFFAVMLISLTVLISHDAYAQSAMLGMSKETAFILNSFMFLICGALVMWMAAGFAMLEAGLVRSRNTAAICLKNVALYALAGIAFYIIGYNIMYTDVAEGGYWGSFSLFYNPSKAEGA